MWDSAITEPLYEKWIPMRCPYGAVGDTLWVRETWGVGNWNETDIAIMYDADKDASRWMNGHHEMSREQLRDFVEQYGRSSWKTSWRKPSIFMPRWASRITLTITDVRVERLQDISEADAIAEGVGTHDQSTTGEGAASAREAYAILWDTINAKRAPWASKPWVWALSFEVQK